MRPFQCPKHGKVTGTFVDVPGRPLAPRIRVCDFCLGDLVYDEVKRIAARALLDGVGVRDDPGAAKDVKSVVEGRRRAQESK